MFNSKTHFRDLNLPDFKFCPGKLTNKMFPISSKVMFSVLFVLFKAEIIVSKLTLHLMRKMFNIRVGKIRFGIWRLKVFFF